MYAFKLIYKIEENNIKNSIKIFGDKFLLLNGKKFKIIIDNKLSPLKKSYKLNKETEYLKIKFIIFDNHGLDFSNMFKNCTSLRIISDSFKKERNENNVKKEENKEKINEKNNSDEFNNNVVQKENINSKDKNNININNNNDENNTHNSLYNNSLF